MPYHQKYGAFDYDQCKSLGLPKKTEDILLTTGLIAENRRTWKKLCHLAKYVVVAVVWCRWVVVSLESDSRLFCTEGMLIAVAMALSNYVEDSQGWLVIPQHFIDSITSS